MSNKIIRASEIGMYMYCPRSFQLLRSGVKAQQTLQDLITKKMIPPVVVSQLQQKNIPLNTTIDKIIGKGLIPKHLEQRIIKQNILLQGTARHEDIGKKTQAGSATQEHRGGWIILLLIIMTIIGFLILFTVRGIT